MIEKELVNDGYLTVGQRIKKIEKAIENLTNRIMVLECTVVGEKVKLAALVGGVVLAAELLVRVVFK